MKTRMIWELLKELKQMLHPKILCSWVQETRIWIWVKMKILPSTSSLLDKAGYELDTPGSEIDDLNESIGEEDEENNYYSLGGDRHENLEEDSKNTF